MSYHIDIQPVRSSQTRLLDNFTSSSCGVCMIGSVGSSVLGSRSWSTRCSIIYQILRNAGGTIGCWMYVSGLVEIAKLLCIQSATFYMGSSLIFPIVICNWGGLWLGMKTCEWLRVSPFSWRGLRPTGGVATSPSASIAGGGTLRLQTRRRAKDAAKQFTPYDWTEFRWEGTKRFRKCVIHLFRRFASTE